MNLDTLVIPLEEIKERLSEWKGILEAERTAEDEAIAAGYRAAARGLPVIEMSRIIEAGGYFENGLPRLAVCRADFTIAWVSTQREWFIFSDTRWPDNRGALVGKWTVRVPRPLDWPSDAWWGSTIVPIIPPRFRPKRNRLHLFHLLWEVEAWDQTPPVDPALVKHIRGDLWAVVATWDLTDLERAVLRARG